MRFLIFEMPTDATLALHERLLDEVCTWVRACDEPPLYNEEALVTRGIEVTPCAFAEGSGAPPADVLQTWLDVCGVASARARKRGGSPRTIAVHDVSGLGRAPLLVALALVEAGLPADTALSEIRNVRRGALGKHQRAIVRDHVPTRSDAARRRGSWLREAAYCSSYCQFGTEMSVVCVCVEHQHCQPS